MREIFPVAFHRQSNIFRTIFEHFLAKKKIQALLRFWQTIRYTTLRESGNGRNVSFYSIWSETIRVRFNVAIVDAYNGDAVTPATLLGSSICSSMIQSVNRVAAKQCMKPGGHEVRFTSDPTPVGPKQGSDAVVGSDSPKLDGRRLQQCDHHGATSRWSGHNLASTAWIHEPNQPHANSSDWWGVCVCNSVRNVFLVHVGCHNPNRAPCECPGLCKYYCWAHLTML